MKCSAQGHMLLVRKRQMMKRVFIFLGQVLAGWRMFLSIFLLCSFSLQGMMGAQPAFAEEERVEITPEQMEEWEEEGIDPNHTEVTENISAYIEENIEDDVFAGMHIEREERVTGVLIFSFTEPIAGEHEQAMRELAEEPAEIKIREVTYTEEELREKQQEIDEDVFAGEGLESEGITVYHTSVDMIGNQVEVGIDPFHEKNAQIIYDRYGEEMVEVVQGQQIIALQEEEADGEPSFAEEDVNDQAHEVSGANEVDVNDQADEGNEEDSNILQRFLQSIKEWFTALFT